jgi:hypothetical protein
MYLFSQQKWLVSKNIHGPPHVGTPFNWLKYYHATLFQTHSSLRLYIDSSHVYLPASMHLLAGHKNVLCFFIKDPDHKIHEYFDKS